MKKYVLLGVHKEGTIISAFYRSNATFVLEHFEADSDKEAKQYVADNYSEDDGRMTLCKLKAIVEWNIKTSL